MATNFPSDSSPLHCVSSINNKPAVSKPEQQHIMDSELRESDVLFTDCVLDFSKYLTSTDLPASPEEFFDDLFEQEEKPKEEMSTGPVRIKEEPCYSTSSSRCSTPESLLPEHDYENDFPSPQFATERDSYLVHQLQRINNNDERKDNMEKKLQEALVNLQKTNRKSSSTSRKAKPSRPSKRKSLDKNSDEYRAKRERNNVAVRKSRTKSKMRHLETQMRVSDLCEENEQLKSKISLLQRELNALRNFVAVNMSPALVSKAPGYSFSAVPSMNNNLYFSTDESQGNSRLQRVC